MKVNDVDADGLPDDSNDDDDDDDSNDDDDRWWCLIEILFTVTELHGIHTIIQTG